MLHQFNPARKMNKKKNIFVKFLLEEKRHSTFIYKVGAQSPVFAFKSV